MSFWMVVRITSVEREVATTPLFASLLPEREIFGHGETRNPPEHPFFPWPICVEVCYVERVEQWYGKKSRRTSLKELYVGTNRLTCVVTPTKESKAPDHNYHVMNRLIVLFYLGFVGGAVHFLVFSNHISPPRSPPIDDTIWKGTSISTWELERVPSRFTPGPKGLFSVILFSSSVGVI